MAKVPSRNNKEYPITQHSPRMRYSGNNYNHQQINDDYDNNDVELYLDSNSRSSGELADTELETNQRRYSRHFTLSPETTDYDSNCGDLDSLSNDLNGCSGLGGINSSASGLGGAGIVGGLSSSGTIIPDFARLYTSMPVLEDGLSSGHPSDTENNNPNPLPTNVSMANNPITSASTVNTMYDSQYINSNISSMGMMLTPSPVNNAMAVNSTNMSAQSNTNEIVDVLSMTATDNTTDTPTTVHTIDMIKPDNFGIGMIGMQQSQTQNQQLAQQREDNRIDSKSYLDSDITSIFSNRKHFESKIFFFYFTS